MEGLEPSRFKKSTDFRTTIVFTTDVPLPIEYIHLWSGLYLCHKLLCTRFLCKTLFRLSCYAPFGGLALGPFRALPFDLY